MTNYTQDETDIIVADSFNVLTYRQKRGFLCAERFDGDKPQKYREELIKSHGAGVYNKLRDNFLSGRYREKVLAALDGEGVVCVTLKSGLYPEYLANTPVPPLVLYCKGDVNLLKGDLFAVVGSRRTLPAYLAACRRISRELCARFNVVTGIADGADSAALEGALEGGRAICVLPNGFGCEYPVYSANLIRRAEREGLVMTEFTRGYPPKKFTFSLRNRILAGLSRGTLVVSAAKKSGALITAAYAAEYGREVFAMPYGIGVSSGEGCNQLIKKGAFLTASALDIFSSFGLEFNSRKKEELTCEQAKALDAIKSKGCAHISEIAAALGKKTYEITAVCASLEIKGLIVKAGGNRYSPSE